MSLAFHRLLLFLSIATMGALCGAPAFADDAVDVAVAWKPGDMLANPAENLVYVVNETDGDIIAVSTQNGNVAAHKRFSYNTVGAQFYLAADASALYVSVPSIRKLYTLHPTTLAQTASVDLDVLIGSFVIAADGFLYACDASESTWQHLLKVDVSSGEELFRLNSPSIYRGALFRLNAAGDGIYALERGLSGGSGGVNEFATSAGAPVYLGDRFTNTSNDQDLAVDDANDRLYRAAGGIYGVSVWNIAAETQEYWTFDGPPYGTAVTQLPNSTSVWGGSGSIYDGVLMEFSKASGNSIREIAIGRNNSDTEDGNLKSGSLEITANGKLLYAKEDWTGNSSTGVNGYLYHIGFTDLPSATVNYTPSTQQPFAPFQITASDETDPDQVDIEWQESPRATSYQIFRGTTNLSGSASQIGSVTAPTTEYADTTAATGVDYYYWVRASNASGTSPFSLSDPGSVLPPPGPPTNFTASDGTFADQVYVSRSYVSGVSGHRIYRSVTNDFASATEVGSSTGTSFYDTTALAGQAYFYWGRMENAAGLGAVSASNAGHAGDFDPPQSAPASLSAADGTSPLNVYLSWSGVSDARSYEIFRHTTADSGAATMIATSTTTYFTDSTAQELVTYHYWIRGINTAGNGPLSASDTGFRAELNAPVAPSYISAADGNYNDRITLNWGSSQYADDYTLYRSTTNDSATAGAIVTTTARSHTDYSATPGVTYYYWVKAGNSAGSSPFSSGDSGFATVPPVPTGPPSSINATDGSYDDKVRITWGHVTYAQTYKVFRAESDNSGLASLIETTTEREFDDYSAVPLQTYFYWVKAANFSGETAFSASNSGFSKVGEPRNVYATNDLFDNMVRVTWNSVASAVRYRIFRHTNSNSSLATQIGSVDSPALRYEDHSAVAGQTYYYWVLAELAGGQVSEFGSFFSDDGRRSATPANGTGFIAADDPRDVEFDMLRGKAYITTSKGIVEVYDLAQKQVINNEWNTNGGLSGADLGPNNQALLLAQTRTTEADNMGWVDRIDLTTDSLQSFGYTRDSYETGAYDVTLLSTDQALVTTSFGGSGWTPFRSLDLSTGTFSIIDATASGSSGSEIRQNSLLSRTPDRSKVLIQESNISSGPFFSYDTATGQLGAPTNTGGFQRRGSISPDGSMLAMVNYPDVEIRSAVNGSVIQTLQSLKSGIVFDGWRPYLFAVDTDSNSVRVLSTNNWAEIDNIALGRAIDYQSSKYREGHLVIDPTSKWLAITFDEGVMILDVSSYQGGVPQAPASLTATDHTTDAGISLAWQASPGATHYKLWRSTTDDFGSASQIAADLSTTTFLDNSIDAGTVYYYWAQGTNVVGSGPASPSDAGERQISAPANLTASDGAHLDRVTLSWSASISAVSYTLLRSSTNDPGTAAQLASAINATTYDDTTATAGTAYYYWVVARNNSGPSDMSSSDSGARKLDAPTDFTINVDESASVALSWAAVEGATSYKVFRGNSNDPQSATEVGQTSSLNYADTTANPGQLQYWFLQASNGSLVGSMDGASVSGRRIFAAPQNFSASQNLRDRVHLSWSQVDGSADSYEIVRSAVDDFAAASPLAESSGTAQSDLTSPIGLPSYYWIRAKSTTTTGEWSSSTIGRRRISTFQEFASENGLAGDDALPEKDPDNDGIDTFREWLLGGSDPANASSRPSIVTGIQSFSGSDYFCISYLRLIGGTENADTYAHLYGNYQAVGNLDLTPEQWDQACIGIAPPAGLDTAPEGYQWGCFRLPVSTDESALGFLKLLVSPAGP